jgi:GNAT superfamily N-acetyltransferase
MVISVDKTHELNAADMSDLCQATEDAIGDGIGFNWVSPPMREVMEQYWRGVLMVPERMPFIGRLDGTVASSIQLVKPGKSKETSAFAANVQAHFVAPWARGHGLAKMLLDAAEHEARVLGYSVMNLNVRATQERALEVYSEAGYEKWGELPYYEVVNGQMIAGHYFYKHLDPISSVT